MGSLNPIYYNYSYCQVQVYHLTTLCFSNLFFVPFLIFFCIRLNQLKCLFFYISALLTCYNSVFFYCNGYFRFIVYVINLSQSVFIIIPLHIKYKHLKIYFHFIRSLLLTSIQFSLPVSQIPHYVVLFIKQFIFYGNINKKKHTGLSTGGDRHPGSCAEGRQKYSSLKSKRREGAPHRTRMCRCRPVQLRPRAPGRMP